MRLFFIQLLALFESVFLLPVVCSRQDEKGFISSGPHALTKRAASINLPPPTQVPDSPPCAFWTVSGEPISGYRLDQRPWTYRREPYKRVQIWLAQSDGWTVRQRKELAEMIMSSCLLIVKRPKDVPLRQGYVSRSHYHWLRFDTISETRCVEDALRCAAGTTAVVPEQCVGM